MTATRRGLVLAIIHVALVCAVAAKLQYDRATLPRVWVESAGVDPDLPIRGRYVALNLLFEAAPESAAVHDGGEPIPGQLEVRDGRAVVVLRPHAKGPPRRGELGFTAQLRAGRTRWMPTEPVAYFLPEHAPDPTRDLRPGELWVEATIPPAGAPRPIRLELRR